MLPYKGGLMFPYSNAGMSALVKSYLDTWKLLSLAFVQPSEIESRL